MTTKTVVTVGSTGDYSLWQSAEDASPTDLTAVDQIYSIQGLGETFTAGAGAVLVSVAGQTTDANRYVELTAALGASFQIGSDTNALRADPSYGCYLTSAQDFKSVVSCATNYTKVSALQIVSTAAAGSAPALDMAAGASGSAVCDVNACIIEGNRGATTGGVVHLYGSGQVIRNSVVTLLGSGQGCIVALMNGAGAYGCTITAPSDLATKPTYVSVGAYAASLFQNCALFGATNMSTGGAAPMFGTCRTDVASPPSGCTAEVYADCFVNTASATRDFRPSATSPLLDAAAVDATYEVGDIRNQIRGSSPDIGAYEYVASSDVTVSVTGLSLTFAMGALTPNNQVGLSGLSLALTQGFVAPSLNGTTTVELTGMGLALTQGAVGTVHTVMPAGLGLSLNQGVLAVGNNVSVALAGMGLALAAGSVAPTQPGDVNVMIDGLAMNLSQGSLATQHVVPLTGIVLDLKAGTLTAQGGTESVWSQVPNTTTSWTNAK